MKMKMGGKAGRNTATISHNFSDAEKQFNCQK